MRIRKLAAELEVDAQDLLALLGRLGHPRYTDVEQQLPTTLEPAVRRAARSLPRVTPAPTLPMPSARVVHADPEVALFAQAMASVRPLGPDPARPRPKAEPPRPAARPASAPPVAPAKAPSVVKPDAAAPDPRAAAAPRPGSGRRPPPPLELQLGEAQARVAELEAALAVARGREAELHARLADAAANLTREQTAVEEQRDRADRLTARLDELDAAAVSLRAVAERRGLRGDDELAVALRGLLDAHRIADLARVAVARPADVEELLRDRLVLLAEDEPVPAGLVVVRVAAERSEGRGSPVNRAAFLRFSSACLVNGVKRVVVIGGSLAQHRLLREGVDARIELTLLPRGQRRAPAADLVLGWGGGELPANAIPVVDPSIAALLNQGADAVARVSGS